MTSVFPLKFNNFIVKDKKFSYDKWWHNCVKSYEDDKWIYSNGEKVTHGDYVKDFYFRLKTIIERSGYSINDEKQFKNEIATFIYQLSSEK